MSAGGTCGAYAIAHLTGTDVEEVFAEIGHRGTERNVRLEEMSAFLAKRGYILVHCAQFAVPEFAEDFQLLTVGERQSDRLRTLAKKIGTSPEKMLEEVIEDFLIQSDSKEKLEKKEKPKYKGTHGSQVYKEGLKAFRVRIPITGQPGLVAEKCPEAGHWLTWDGQTLWDPSQPEGKQATHWGRHEIIGFIPVSKSSGSSP